MLRVNTNVSAMDTHHRMAMLDVNIGKSLQKLSSGLRINQASDDAAGLSIANRLRTQVNGLQRANANAQDGINLLNVADGALNEIGSILQRMRELAVQSANGTLTTSDRSAANAEVQQLMSEIDNISSYTTFNSYQIMNAAATTFTFQVGAYYGQTTSTAITGTSTGGLALTGLSTTNQTNAANALKSLDAAIGTVDGIRAALGAVSNRLEHAINNLGVSQVNVAAAESRIRDVDMASEVSSLTKNQILINSATSMLAQANAGPQMVGRLFK